jgi:hypothetical protein
MILLREIRKEEVIAYLKILHWTLVYRSQENDFLQTPLLQKENSE